jgi:hypothetical protein
MDVLGPTSDVLVKVAANLCVEETTWFFTAVEVLDACVWSVYKSV